MKNLKYPNNHRIPCRTSTRYVANLVPSPALVLGPDKHPPPPKKKSVDIQLAFDFLDLGTYHRPDSDILTSTPFCNK